MHKRLIAYDGLRIIFIFFMILHHLDLFYDINIPNFSTSFKKLSFEGFVGVNFFFMLSGFCCMHFFQERLIKHQISPLYFLFNRFIKLYPLYIFFLFLSFINNNLEFINFKFLILNFILCQSLPFSFDNVAFSFNGVSWYLSVQFFLYIFFIFIYKISFKKLTIFIFLLFFYILVNILFSTNMPARLFASLYYTNPIFRILDFCVGMWCSLLIRNKFLYINFIFLQVFSLIFFVSFIFIGAFIDIPIIYKYQIFYLFPCFLLLFSFYQQTKLVLLLFNHRFLHKLVLLIPTIYLSHQIILVFIKIHLINYFSIYFPLSLIVTLFIIIIFSLVVYLFLYLPTYHLLSKLNCFFKH